MIRAIRAATARARRSSAYPMALFWALLKIYALFDRDPPFTTSQLEALVIPDVFEVIDWPAHLRRATPTPLAEALRETFRHPDLFANRPGVLMHGAGRGHRSRRHGACRRLSRAQARPRGHGLRSRPPSPAAWLRISISTACRSSASTISSARRIRPTFDLMAELGIADSMRWRANLDGLLHRRPATIRWGDPVSLLALPQARPDRKLRYGLHDVPLDPAQRLGALEHVSAREWITTWCGRRRLRAAVAAAVRSEILRVCRRHLGRLDLDADQARRHLAPVRCSRRSSATSMAAARPWSMRSVQAIEAWRHASCVSALASAQIASEDRRVTGVARRRRTARRRCRDLDRADALRRGAGSRPAGAARAALRRHRATSASSASCSSLPSSVTPHFWVNIVDAGIDIPGIIEFSNLRTTADTVVYVPYYMPTDAPEVLTVQRRASSAEGLRLSCRAQPARCRRRTGSASHVGRLRHAQPVCPPGFAAKLPPVQTPIAGLQIADTCFYYPEDRGISESVRYGQLMAEAVADPAVWDAKRR